MHPLSRFAIALLLAAPIGARAEQCWHELRFAANNGWLGATASVSYSLQSATLAGAELSNPPQGVRLQPHGDSVGRIDVQFAALRSTGTLHIWHDPRTQQVLQTRRLVFWTKTSRLQKPELK